jgi:hypothetical protein
MEILTIGLNAFERRLKPWISDLCGCPPTVRILCPWSIYGTGCGYHTGYDQKADLIAQVDRFQAQINADPMALADRLWVKSHLNPKEEKLRVST